MSISSSSGIPNRRHWFALIGIALAVLALDQLTKTLVIERLALGESWSPIPAVADFFQITHSVNSGAAFSLFSGANTPLLLLALAMIVGILVVFRQTPPDRRLQIVAMAILLGGVMGNALDRIRYGTVIDFIHWQIPRVVSNVSNLADHAIVLSVILLFISQSRLPASHSSDTPSVDAHPDQTH